MEQPSVGIDWRVLAAVGDTGTGVGNYHLHFCVTTAPDRPELDGSKPFESVPMSFRNYEMLDDNLDFIYTDVSQGVPRRGQRLRRKGTTGSAAINFGASPNGVGSLTTVVKLAGPGRPSSNGVITLTVMSKWGEPLKSVNLPVGNITSGPWVGTITGVPAYAGLKVVASYSGGWSIPTPGGWNGGQQRCLAGRGHVGLRDAEPQGGPPGREVTSASSPAAFVGPFTDQQYSSEQPP